MSDIGNFERSLRPILDFKSDPKCFLTLTFLTLLSSRSSCPTRSMFLLADRLALYFCICLLTIDCWQLFFDNCLLSTNCRLFQNVNKLSSTMFPANHLHCLRSWVWLRDSLSTSRISLLYSGTQNLCFHIPLWLSSNYRCPLASASGSS